jgi:hypothetical protein
MRVHREHIRFEGCFIHLVETSSRHSFTHCHRSPIRLERSIELEYVLSLAYPNLNILDCWAEQNIHGENAAD